MHVAETREQAYKDVEYGIETWFRYFQKTAAFPQMAVEGGDVKEMIDFINEAGIGAIGTVEDARAQVERLWDQSGGFGAMLLLAHEWANPADEALLRAHRPARHAALPGRRDQPRPGDAGRAVAGSKREDYAAQQMQAVATMTERYQQELAAKDSS